MPKVCPVCDTVYPDANAFCPVDGTTLHVVDLEGGLIGSVVADRYLVTDLLGEGGMGKVYLARHVRLPQQAAIKVLRKEMVRDPGAVARFNREASNASRIDDEHVARVYDFGEASGGTVYLAMEYVPGRTLREIITKDGALEPRRAADLVDQIAMGLDAAHRLKIIHRDLKPDNILVVEGPDGRDRVKVVDFGIAKAFGAEDGNLTKTGFVVGTPEFMSPEQLMGGALDARSDVYALALVAFQCFTASLPFGGDTPEMTMTARLTKAPRRLAEISNKDWPPALQAAFDAALSREVDARPASAGAFARLVTAAVAGWVPGQPAKVAGANGGAKGAAKSGAKGATVKIAGAASASDAPRSGGRWPLVAGLVAVLAVGGFFAFRFMQPSGAAVADAATETPTSGGTGMAPRLPAAPAATTQDSTAVAAAIADSSPSTTPVNPRDAVVTPPRVAAQPATKGTPEPAAPPAPKVTAPSAPAVDPSLRSSLDSLAGALGARGVDAATARRIASALRSLASRIGDPALKTQTYFRLIDASALSGDLAGACDAVLLAKGSARPSQLGELRRYEEQLGCS